MKEYRKARLICRIFALVFLITSLVFTLLLNREMPDAEMPLTWSNSNIKLIADVSRTHAFGIVSTYDFLSILQERASVDVEYIIDEHIYESIIGVGLG